MMAKSASAKAGKHPNPSAVAPGAASNRKYIITAGAVILGIGIAVIAAMPKDQPAEPAQAARIEAPSGTGLYAAETSFNFGSISMAAGKVTHRFRVNNSSAGPVVIQKLYTSCMCTTAALVKGVRQFGPFGMPGHTPIPTINQTLVPGERVYVEVVFDPAAHGPAGVGPIERVVTIENSAQPPLQLAFSAQVRP